MTFPDSAASARPKLSPGWGVGVTEAMIYDLVHAFYGKVRQDPELGPVFGSAISDWEPHLARMCDFWSSVTLMTGRYHGTPMQVHAARPEVRPAHFARWLELFARTAREICPPDAAALFVDRAERIGESLQIGIAIHRGEPPPRQRVEV